MSLSGETLVYIWLFGSILVYIALVAVLLTNIFLRLSNPISKPTDRGVNKFVDGTNRGIRYETYPTIRKYIPEYVLMKRDGKKVFIGKINPGIQFINFDIVLFDVDNKIINTLNVKELVDDGAEYLKDVYLPSQTAYVSVILNSVNAKTINTVSLGVKVPNLIAFSIITFILSVVEAFGVERCMAKLLAGKYMDYYYGTVGYWIIPFVIGIVVTLLSFLAVYLLLRLKSDNKGSKKKKL